MCSSHSICCWIILGFFRLLPCCISLHWGEFSSFGIHTIDRYSKSQVSGVDTDTMHCVTLHYGSLSTLRAVLTGGREKTAGSKCQFLPFFQVSAINSADLVNKPPKSTFAFCKNLTHPAPNLVCFRDLSANQYFGLDTVSSFWLNYFVRSQKAGFFSLHTLSALFPFHVGMCGKYSLC